MDEHVRHIVSNRYNIACVDRLIKNLDLCAPFEKWKQGEIAFCFYGPNQYSRNVQISGLKEAFESIGIPFHIFYHGNQVVFDVLKRYSNVYMLTNEFLLPGIESIIKATNCKLLLFWRYYDDTPDSCLAPKIDEKNKGIIDKYKRHIILILSELSYEGNKQYLHGYVKDFGIPVMSFPWGVNLKRHVPFDCRPKRDVFYIGTYYEKAKRINEYFGKIIKRYTNTIIGPDWRQSPYKWLSNNVMEIDEFNAKISHLYSSHLVSLNIHHSFEINGFSCNERVFNAIACGGFLLSDNARRIRELFDEDEIITASDSDEYYDKAAFFIENPEARTPYKEKAIMKVYAHHTYHHRAADMLSMIFSGKPQTAYCPVMDT